MAEAPKKPYYSPSQINMFLRCAKQWEFRYVDGLRRPPAGAMVQGSAGHAAVEHNLVRKLNSKKDEPLDVVLDVFGESYDERVKAEDPIWEEGQGQSALKDQGYDLVKAHHTEIAPRLRPAEVEQKYVVNVGEYDLLGYLDLVEESGVIVDLKFKGRTPSQADVDSDVQFSTYALMRMLVTGNPEQKLRMDVALKQKKVRTAQLHTTRTTQDGDWLLNITDAVHKSVTAGVFPPNPNGWWCSARFCGYWSSCRGKYQK